ncbi:MAG: LTA synthase family protein [Clostridiales Family XIII bacterium]|jgi:phosphoglycerol transferase MdoB-like AlkP superfamily enzyme|nr:LTA synthase family protein [Clostridiales Family XIII bacterium]
MKLCYIVNELPRRIIRVLKKPSFLEAAAFAIMAALKQLFFYALVGVQSYFAAVWMIGCVFTLLLFSSFRNKLAPGIIYFLISGLMFMDVAYSSYFNRYLSVNLMGAAGVLGDIGASFLAVIRPEYFLLFFDAAAALAVIVFRAVMQFVKKRRERTEFVVGEIKTADDGFAAVEVCGGDGGRQDGSFAAADAVGADGDSGGRFGGLKVLVSTASRRVLQQIKKHKSAAALLAALIFIVWNPFGVQALTAVSNQELITYHISDALGGVFGGSSASGSPEGGFMELIAADNYANEKDGELFGIAEGRNLIMIQVESLQNFVVGLRYNGKEVTPNLNRLIGENTIYFDSIFHQVGGGNTSDAEFAVNNSICGTAKSYTYKLFCENKFRGLPILLKEKGYKTNVFHAHEDRMFWNRDDMYKTQGFERYYGGLIGRDGDYLMTQWMGWGLADTEFFEQTISFMQDVPSPSYSFVITLSNHHPFQPIEEFRFLDILSADQRTIVGNYLQSVAYTDYAIGQFLDALKDEGMYDDALIVIYGDHQGMPIDDRVASSMERLYGMDYDYDVMMNIPLLISLPEGEDIKSTVSATGGQIDFLPTIAYLMGFEELDTIHLGHNLLTAGGGVVAVQSYMVKGSFIENDVVYEMPRDGIFENGRAWKRSTGESVPLEDCREAHLKALQIIDASEYILENDLMAGDWRSLRGN